MRIWDRSWEFCPNHQNDWFLKENPSKKWGFGTDPENSVRIHQNDRFLKEAPSKKWRGVGADPKNSVRIHQNDRFFKENPFKKWGFGTDPENLSKSIKITNF